MITRFDDGYNEGDEAEIAALLVGHRIVEADLHGFERPESGRGAAAEGRLVLDDGTVLYLVGNDGGCACNAGCYPLANVTKVDNIITSVRIECSPDDGGYYEPDIEGAYRIFVVADAVEINVAEFLGTDGNGYYGTGFALYVEKPEVK